MNEDFYLTLTLSEDWDLMLDGGGNIAVSVGAYSVAQNVANASRLFTNDAWYDPEKGIPHFAVELGQKSSRLGMLRSRLIKAAQAVEGVASATVNQLSISDRVVTGDIRLTLTSGEGADVAF